MNGILSIVEKQNLFNEFMELVNKASKLPPAEQLRATLKIEDWLADIYEKGYNAGFKKGSRNAIDVLKK